MLQEHIIYLYKRGRTIYIPTKSPGRFPSSPHSSLAQYDLIDFAQTILTGMMILIIVLIHISSYVSIN